MTPADRQIFEHAIASFQAGALDEAERGFGKFLQRHPRQFAALNLYGILLTQLSRFGEAEKIIRRAIDVDARSDTTFYNYAIVLKALKRPAEAYAALSKAIELNALVAESWNNRGTVLNDLMRYREAIADFDKAIAINSNYPDAFCNKGKSLAGLKLYDQSLGAYDRALTLKPDLAEAWIGRGAILTELKQYKNALAAYDRALTLWPDLAETWLGRGNILAELKRYKDALVAYDRALTLKPDFAEAWLGRGYVFTALKQYNDAFAAYDKVLALKPDLAHAWLGRGNVFTELKQYDDAFAAYDQALTLEPEFAGAWLGRGNIFAELKQRDEALVAYDQALAFKPDLASAWLGRGNIFTDLKRYDDALAAYDRALTIEPDLAEAWLGRANILTELKRYDDASAAYDKALTIEPDLAEAWLGRGHIFTELRQYGDACAAYDRALAIKPDLKYAKGSRLCAMLSMCDWRDLEAEVSRLLLAVRDHKPASVPFPLLSISSSAADQLICAQTFAAERMAGSSAQVWQGERYVHDRLRIAYVSADFCDHAVAHLLAGLFEHHNRSQFETIAISLGPDDRSILRARVEGAFERFIDVCDRADADVARLMREHEVDIAIDLMGYTMNSRPALLPSRPAPIQVNYLGYAGTMGAGHIDYIIGDRFVIPGHQHQHFSEHVVYLPETFLAYDNKQNISEPAPARTEQGLPESGFVFCAFNNTFKLTPQLFDIWMRLLGAVGGSVLWLSKANDAAVRNLRREAEARGVDAGRLIFAPRLERMEDHLARLRLADLFLDTLPYGAHTTASDALWAGLPVLTCRGETFAGRVAASLLNAVGLPEFVTDNLAEYEALALKLAREPALLAEIKAKLARNRDSYPLFDTARFTRHIEAAYTTMQEIWQRGEAPRSFSIEPI